MRAALLCLLAASSATSARADDDPATPLFVALSADQDTVIASFDVTHALTESFRKRLINGLTSRVSIEMRLIDPDDRPIARTSRQCKFQFDIWDEVLEVRVEDGRRGEPAVRHRLIDRGLAQCGLVSAIKLAHRSLLVDPTGYHLEVLVQLNPVSEEQVQRAREFMSNPKSTRRGRPRTFFDTVASFFGDTPRFHDDEFVFRSQFLARPAKRGP